MIDANKAAQRFIRDILKYHADEITGEETLRDAVIVKSMALSCLAYDLPPTDDSPWDMDEIMANLRKALLVLRPSPERSIQ